MSTFKRISGDYTIQSVGVTDRIIINSGNVFIEGNLWVSGNTQTISSTNTSLNDHIITLNAGAVTANPYGANIVVARGTSANVSIGWNETLQVWQISNNGTSSANILAGSTAGIMSVSADTSPSLGGNLNLNGRTIWDSTTNQTVVSLGSVGGAGSGVYATPTGSAPAELVTQSKALAYSIIFG